MQRPADELSPPIEAYADAVASSLREGLRATGCGRRGSGLEAEPGRALFADAGIHLATVRNVKAQTRPIAQRWVEMDTTEMFLPDGLIEHNRWTVVAASRADEPASQEADVVGMSCGFDVIVAGAALPDVEPATSSRSSTPARIRTPPPATSTPSLARRPSWCTAIRPRS